MTPTQSRRFIIVVQVGSPRPEHLAKMVPALQTTLARLSDASPEMAFRAISADIFGMFIRTSRNAAQITAALESPGNWLRGAEPFLAGDDSLFVMEIGENFRAGAGFTRAGTWLQRH